jgi:exodeoxyribonuclease VIII
MINATHYVLDLETMGTGPSAAIVAIGCVKVADGQIADEFYTRVDLESSLHSDGTVTAKTIQWWLKQSEEARREVDGSQHAQPLIFALRDLDVFMDDDERQIFVWGNGSSFDNVILRSAYAAFGDEAPWPFWADRDLRTLLHLYPEAKRAVAFEGIQHHALHDARHEARQLVAALEMHEARATAGGSIQVPADPTPAMVAAAEEAYMPFGDMHLAIQVANLTQVDAVKEAGQ